MRRILSNSSPLAFVAWFACAHAIDKPVAPPPNTSARGAAQNSALLAAAPADPLRITVERAHGVHRANGTVLLRHADAPAADRSLFLKLAGSRAWLALGQQRSAAEDLSAAVACAQAGLEELGLPPRIRGVFDDSTLHLGVAQDHIKRGNLDRAASIMLEILAERVQLYSERYAVSIEK